MRHGITGLNDDDNKLNEKRGKRDPMRGNFGQNENSNFKIAKYRLVETDS